MPTQAFAETLQQRVDRLEPHFTLARPDGAGPFPAVIMLDGWGRHGPDRDEVEAVAARGGAAPP